jgi:hypothetical protein
LEGEVPALGLELNLAVCDYVLLVKVCLLECESPTISSQLRHQSADDGHKGHKHSEEHSGQKTSDDTQDDLRDLQDPFKPGETVGQVVDVGDETNESDYMC